MKKFIFFRNDRLGDFIILTNLIKAIKKKYKNSHITILCSPINHNLIKKYKIIDQVFVYDRTTSLLTKIKVLHKIINSNYFASFAVDGKSFSNLCNFLITSNYKLGLVYKYRFLNFFFTKPNFLYNFFVYDKFVTFTSKKYLKKIEHLPSKFIELGNFLGLSLNIKDPYYFETDKKESLKFNRFKTKNLKKKYILIHLDEKWTDINSIEKNLFESLLYLQSKTKIQLVLTSFKNNFNYFKILKRKINQHKFNVNFLMIENSNLFFFERLINYSMCSVSCHAGFLVQIAGTNYTNLIDIVARKDYRWYSCWKPKNTKHKFIFKSNNKINLPINTIFKNLAVSIRSYLL